MGHALRRNAYAGPVSLPSPVSAPQVVQEPKGIRPRSGAPGCLVGIFPLSDHLCEAGHGLIVGKHRGTPRNRCGHPVRHPHRLGALASEKGA